MVIRVSYLVLSILVRSLVVTSMRVLSIVKKSSSVAGMIFLSEVALLRANSASLVHSN